MDQLSMLGSEDVKAKIAAQLQAHYDADEIVKGKYWEKGKGCCVGCIIHGNDHASFEPLFGVPGWCARLIDTLFEGLVNGEAKKFPLEFWAAVPIGKNEAWWNSIKWKFCIFILKENIERVSALDISEDLKKKVVDAIRQVLRVHENALENGWDKSAAESAAGSAWSAAESVWSAAESAARSAGSAARSAGSAAGSAAESAWTAAYSRYAKELIRLLQES